MDINVLTLILEEMFCSTHTHTQGCISGGVMVMIAILLWSVILISVSILWFIW